MKLSKEELIRKFPQLKKFQDQRWISDEAVKHDCNYKKFPLIATFELIKESLSFIETTKFSNNWEAYISIKVRLQQIEDLLLHFCEDTEQEKTIKGENINP